MDPQTIFLPAKPRVSRKRHVVTPSTPTAPVLVSATFEITDSAILTLGFDRAVSIAGISPAAFAVAHHPSEQAFVGDSSELVDPATVRIVLNYADACDAGDDVVLNASG